MKILLVHGVGHEGPNPEWPGQWEKAIADGLKQYGYSGPIQFVPESPVMYDDLFEQNPEPTPEYLRALYELLKHGHCPRSLVPAALGCRQTRGVFSMILVVSFIV